jgi:hypothetical protein
MGIYKGGWNFKGIYKGLAAVLAVALSVTTFGVSAAVSAETPEAIYTGTPNAAALLRNIDYPDVKASKTWARQAIYETGALEIMKLQGSKQFGLNTYVTREEAIAIAYRAAGREADAQARGETMNNALPEDQQKNDPQEVLMNGYLQLAADEQLITRQNLQDALETDPQAVVDFNRKAPAQRQEFAFWLAKTLKLPAAATQQKVHNYPDWKSIDANKISVMETILQNGIMSGDGNGRFNPYRPISREMAAQVVKNAMKFVLPVQKMTRLTGTVEAVTTSKDYTGGTEKTIRTYHVRNSNGQLHKINVTTGINALSGQNRNEQRGTEQEGTDNDFIVYKAAAVGNSSLLGIGDRVEYTVTADRTVKYASVLSSTFDTKYVVATVNSVNTGILEMNVTQLFKLDYPSINTAQDYISFGLDGENVNEIYKYSGSVLAVMNNVKVPVQDIKPDTYIILTLKNNVITGISGFDLRVAAEGGVVKGIVEDNNPQLGYITLYNEDGTGNTPQSLMQLSLYRTYNYGNQNDMEIYKNHRKAQAEEIETGDTVFIKLDSSGNIISMSGVENYDVEFARILSTTLKTLSVQYDDGTQQVLDVDAAVLVTSGGRLVRYTDLKDGDRVRLLLHATNKFTKVREIAVENERQWITGIYKAKIAYIDEVSDKLVTQNLETLTNGQWVKADRKGVTGIPLAEEFNLYAGGAQMDISRVNRLLKGNEAYIAVNKDYGGEEQAVLVSFRSEDDAEIIYNDTVANTLARTGEFTLFNANSRVKSDKGTIVIKDGRLVSGTNIVRDDSAYVVVNRSDANGQLFAGVVNIDTRTGGDFVQIYRARIKSINDSKDFTVESFSQLKGLTWSYANTPKTFRLNPDTKIMDDTGVVNQRDFIDYGSSSYANRTVYILAKDTDTVLISTVPYGIYNVRGQIFDITGGKTGEEGTVTLEPTGLKLRNVKVYDLGTYTWSDIGETSLSLPQNSIILKNKSIAKPSDLKKGDRIRVIKKDNTTQGEAYIVLVE